MMLSLSLSLVSLLALPLVAVGQSGSDGYTGYRLEVRDDGDPLAVLFQTETTNTASSSNVSALVPEPDVLLDASVHVGDIFIGVDNLTAKINLEAQVLQLLQFNAGVDLSIDKVSLLIQNVTAKVLLEARLANLVAMVSDVLDSVDLNPVIAQLGSGLGTVLNDTASLVANTGNNLAGSSSSTNTTTTKRDLDLHQWDLYNNILYSVNNFQANANMRHILAQNGDIVQQTLDDHGVQSTSAPPLVVGPYTALMRFTGFNQSLAWHGQDAWEEEWIYAPFAGLYSVCAIVRSRATGAVIATRLLADARAGGSADIGNER